MTLVLSLGAKALIITCTSHNLSDDTFMPQLLAATALSLSFLSKKFTSLLVSD